MRLESIVRSTLGLKDHRVVGVGGDRGELWVELERIGRRRLPCGSCGQRGRVRDRLRSRRWRHVPLWGIPVRLVYRPARVACPRCGIRVEAVPWGSGKSPLSEPLVVVLATWARLLAWDVVARLFGVSWSTVAAAVERAVAHGLARRDQAPVFYLGIDEISRRRGHVYHTQVYDLSRKRLLWSGEGKNKAALQRFFQEWGPERTAQIQALCCDMSPAYIAVIQEMVPHALLVFDKFHIVRHLLEAVDAVRHQEAHDLRHTNPDLLTGTRYLWLKHSCNLTPQERGRLSHLERLNLRINRAYLLKEMFCQLWQCQSRQEAERLLDRWFSWATRSRLNPIRAFAWMVRRRKAGILAWFDVPLDNGATEALNNSAKAISHRARGYRTAKIFTLALLHGLGRLPLPQTTHRFA